MKTQMTKEERHYYKLGQAVEKGICILGLATVYVSIFLIWFMR